MTRMNSRLLRLLAVVLALMVLGAACGGDDDEAGGGTQEPADEAAGGAVEVPDGPDTTAAILRSNLHALLQEHVALTAAATNAALGGRVPEFEAATAAVNANSDSIIALIGSVFGDTVGADFDPLWKAHVGFIVDYTKALGANNGAGQSENLQKLADYSNEFGAFINSALPDLSQESVAELINTHIGTLRTVIDAQAAGDQTKAFTELRNAAGHMGEVAETLTAAIAAKFPAKVGGDPESEAAELLTTLTSRLREHVFLVSGATNAALAGRTDEFTSAAGALDANSDAITAAMGSVYGAEAGKAFAPLWEKHIGLFVDYTTGLAGKDKAKQDAAVAKLLDYSKEFGAFINSASSALTTEVVADLIKTHVVTLKSVIDAQGQGNQPQAYSELRTAADHMKAIATPLTGAIVAQFKDKY